MPDLRTGDGEIRIANRADSGYSSNSLQQLLAVAMTLPELIADDSNLGICAGAGIRIVRRKQAAKKRSCAQYRVSVAGNGEDAVLGKYAVDFNIGEGVRAPGRERGEDLLAAFDFAEHR